MNVQLDTLLRPAIIFALRATQGVRQQPVKAESTLARLSAAALRGMLAEALGTDLAVIDATGTIRVIPPPTGKAPRTRASVTTDSGTLVRLPAAAWQGLREDGAIMLRLKLIQDGVTVAAWLGQVEKKTGTLRFARRTLRRAIRRGLVRVV